METTEFWERRRRRSDRVRTGGDAPVGLWPCEPVEWLLLGVLEVLDSSTLLVDVMARRIGERPAAALGLSCLDGGAERCRRWVAAEGAGDAGSSGPAFYRPVEALRLGAHAKEAAAAPCRGGHGLWLPCCDGSHAGLRPGRSGWAGCVGPPGSAQ
jgi:hypothetical protein